MKFLRLLHLYSGCIFAPLLIFFAVSGIWQMLHWHWLTDSGAFAQLSTIHTGRALKSSMGKDLSSPLMNGLAIAMAVSLIFTIVIGIMMAFRMGHRKVAAWCLFVGAVVPVGFVLLAMGR